MAHSLLAAALVAASAPAPASALPAAGAPGEPRLSAENRALVRCAAAFSMVAHGQSLGNEDARKWPQIEERGREYFVRGLAQVMDETGLDREGVARLVSAEAQRLWDSGSIDDVMPPCLLLLDASGL